MAGAVEVLGLVKSARVVVVSVDARERHQYRGLVLALPLPAETADRRSRRRVRHRADAPSLRGIRLWLRIQIVPSARGRSAFDTWLSSVMIGRSVATVAEVCFAAQWAIALHQLGTMTGADTTLNAAWVIVPLILIAECFSWYAVLTKKYVGNAIENSIWALAFFIVAVGLCRLLPEFDGAARVALVVAIIGIAGYLAFLATIDVPMYLTRWRAEVANGSRPLSPLEGLRDASFRWVVTHDIAEWKDEIAWMSLYFSAAVWASLALCVCYCAYGAH
jgi:hypothetical protein